MPWKFDEEEKLVKGEDNNPIWIYEEGNEKGKEVPADFNRMFARINELTNESVERKGKIKEIEDLYRPVAEQNIENLEEWLGEANSAMETVANLSNKDVLAAGEIDLIKKGITDSYDQKMQALSESLETTINGLNEKLQGKDVSIRNLIIRSAFDRSEFLKDRTVLLPDMAYTYFGDRFDVEEVNGELNGFAKNKDGNKLMSLDKPGEFATPDEAIELIVMDHPQKDRMLRQDSTGTGSGPSNPPKGSDLMVKYYDAVATGDIETQISLKNQMAAKGMKAPI